MHAPGRQAGRHCRQAGSFFHMLFCVAQELRMHNMAAIRVARRQHKDTCSDADGYDLISVPEVSMYGKFVQS